MIGIDILIGKLELIVRLEIWGEKQPHHSSKLREKTALALVCRLGKSVYWWALPKFQKPLFEKASDEGPRQR